jgi:hypothetical protein
MGVSRICVDCRPLKGGKQSWIMKEDNVEVERIISRDIDLI